MIHKWLKRLISVLEIGGGFLGFVLCMTMLAASSGSSPNTVILLFFSGVFFFGIIAGVCLIENRKSGTILSLIFQGIQIFQLSSLPITYSLGTGFVFTLVILNRQFSFEFSFGSQFSFYLFQSDAPFSIGINLVSLFFFLYLLCVLIGKKEEKTEQQQETNLTEDDSQKSVF